MAVAVPLAFPQFSFVVEVLTLNGVTLTETEVLPEQPEALVPVTEYDIVVIGFAVTIVPVVPESPVFGFHV